MRLLVTRPEPDAQRTAIALRTLGHDVLVAPLLRFEPIADADLGEGPWAATLMTSANAARSAARHPRFDELARLPALVVGRRTAQAAQEAGIAHVSSADGNADSLARLAAGRFPGTIVPLLYLAAEERAVDLACVLAGREVPIRTVVVYRMPATPALPAAVAAALSSRTIDGVLHYSRRSAETYLRLAGAAGLGVAALLPTHYCLSSEVAAPLADAGSPAVRIAARPDDLSLFAQIDGA